MRSYLGLFVIGTLLTTAACQASEADDTTGDTTGGKGGEGTGGEGEGGGGEGGAPPDECEGVPMEGECIDGNKIRTCFISETPGEPPEIIEIECSDLEECDTSAGWAACVPTGDCYEGSTRCADATTLEECIDGKWVATDCGGIDCVQKPGAGASCTMQEAGSGIKLRGHVDYEFHKPNKDFTDFDPSVSTEAAVDMFVTVFDMTDGALTGMGLTSFGGGGLAAGDWEIEVSRPPNDQTFYFFWPMLFDQSGNPFMALAHAESPSAAHQSSSKYWYFGFGPVCEEGSGECGKTDVGTDVITEDMGSGAVYIYQWLDFGIFRMSELVPDVNPFTFAVFWEPENQFDCGSCFAPPQMGGANVAFDEKLSDHYDSSLNISGTAKVSPHHWGKTTINHELGHWVMQAYSKSPGEGGPHYVDEASKPGLAYSEGWATFMGQTNLSAGPDNPDPIAFRKSQGTTFWVDLEKVVWSGGTLELPDPDGPADQFVNENVVSALMWSLWASAGAHDPQGLGDEPMFRVLNSDRLLGDINRGYVKVDLFDYLDALKCDNAASGEQIDAVSGPLQYPYDNQEQCK